MRFWEKMTYNGLILRENTDQNWPISNFNY